MPTRRRILEEINALRRRHNNHFPLHFHEEESEHAQKHAEHMARSGKLEHTQGSAGHGFNSEVIAKVPAGLSPEGRAKAAVRMWEHSPEGHGNVLLSAEWHAAIGEKDGFVVVRLKRKN